MLRYGIALIVAALIILGGILFVRQTHSEIESIFEPQRLRLKQQKADGTLPEEWKDVDLDAIEYTDFGMAVPPAFQLRLELTMWLVGFWWLFAPLVVVAWLGAAFLLGRIFRHGPAS